MYFGHWEISVFVVPDINWVSPDSGDDLGITFYSVVFLFKEESAFRCRSSLCQYTIPVSVTYDSVGNVL